MTYWIGPVLGIIGAVLLVYGFNKNSRKILAGAGIVLFLAGAAGDFMDGFLKGLDHPEPQAAQVAAPRGEA